MPAAASPPPSPSRSARRGPAPAHHCTLGDDQANLVRRPAGIIVRHILAGNAAWRFGAGHRRHHDPVAQGDAPQLHRRVRVNRREVDAACRACAQGAGDREARDARSTDYRRRSGDGASKFPRQI